MGWCCKNEINSSVLATHSATLPANRQYAHSCCQETDYSTLRDLTVSKIFQTILGINIVATKAKRARTNNGLQIELDQYYVILFDHYLTEMLCGK